MVLYHQSFQSIVVSMNPPVDPIDELRSPENFFSGALGRLNEKCFSWRFNQLTAHLQNDGWLQPHWEEVLNLKLVDKSSSSLSKSISYLSFQLAPDNRVHVSLINQLIISSAAQWMRTLKSVDLTGFGKVTDTTICHLAKFSPGLVSLNLKMCILLTDKSISAVASACSNLAIINLWACVLLTDLSVRHLAANCSRLYDVDLGYCDQLTDSAISSIMTTCTRLQRLNIRGCSSLSSTCVEAAPVGCLVVASFNSRSSRHFTS